MAKSLSHWTSSISYLLSIIGFVIGLGNFWLFPTTCYANGGAVFLIPYSIFMLIFGIPLVYLELLLGQVLHRANLGIYEVLCPWLKGAAYSVIIMNFIRQTYYNTVIAWALNLFFHSFSVQLPWRNDTLIFTVGRNASANLDDIYFHQVILGKTSSHSINHLGGLQTSLLPCLLLVFIVVYLIIRKGAISIGKSIYVTAILPYVLLFILLVKSATLEGVGKGMRELFKSDFKPLLKMETWYKAATQICYSLGPGAGVLVAYASFSDNTQMNIKLYAFIIVLCNAFTSIICGIILFCGLGYFESQTSLSFSKFIDYGYTIIFVIYPMIITKFAYGFIFSIAFFSMIFMIGLNSVYAEIESMYAALCDRFKSLRDNEERNKLIILVMCFLASLPTITHGGDAIVSFLLEYGVTPAVLIIIVAETFSAAWYFGYDNLIERVEQYSDANTPGTIMKWCWKIVVPVVSIVLYITNYVGFNNDVQQSDLDRKIKLAGNIFSILILLPVPMYACFYFIRKLFARKKAKIDSLKFES
ncbi:hypothetical protein GJ496_009496 [Pomphorhynchus laevis]|nr:hypothetical protein GJ496_009496 [Pomphorhynchus laevis]